MNEIALIRRTGGMAVYVALSLGVIAQHGCSVDRERPGPAPDELSGAELRAHIEILAADDMQGREAGTAGYLRAADYVAARFADLDLEPLGDDGGYFQRIDFFETRLAPGSASMVLHRSNRDAELEFGEDFVRTGGFGPDDESVTAPLVFVGFGIQAPEYDHDDFAGLDVAGKILVELTGAPPSFATDERAFYSSSVEKQELAVDLGAVGIVTIRTPVDLERLPWDRYVSATASPEMRWLESDDRPHRGFPELAGNAVLSESGADRLFALAERDLAAVFERHLDGETGGFDLGVFATLARRSEQRRTSSPNVLGLLRGADGELRDEYVLYTAHLDHLGIRPGTERDDIHNGAYDNAAGVAVILEVAAAMQRTGTPPRRSIIFAAVTAEEKGLQGSEYLAHHPPVPIEDIVANINIDMPYLGFPIADVEAFGAEHTTLHGAVSGAAERVGLALTPDPRPELVRFIRSDQFSFVQQGIPGLILKPGSKSADPAIDGGAMLEEFLRLYYHRPGDDTDLPFDEEAAERFTRTALLLGLSVANDDRRPRWNEHDFFGDRFAR